MEPMVRRALFALSLALGACAAPQAFREPGPLAPAVPHPEPELRLLLLGDNGAPTARQRSVASAIDRWSASHPVDFIVQPGDNVYGCGPDPRLPGAESCRFAEDGATVAPGVTAPDDPLFRRNEGALRSLRGRDGGPLTSYLALGNHDIGAESFCRIRGMKRDEWMRLRACLEVARRSPWWRMPGRHYVLDRGSVRFIFVDSNTAVADYGGFTLEGEEAFVREASTPCGELTCFLVAHHPPAIGLSGAPPAAIEPGIARMGRLVAAAEGRVTTVLAGHAHSLEHLTLGDLDVLISGSSSRRGSPRFVGGWPAEARLHFATSAPGFGVLEVWAGGWSFRLVDDEGRSLHCCEATGRGRCLPVRCGL